MGVSIERYETDGVFPKCRELTVNSVAQYSTRASLSLRHLLGDVLSLTLTLQRWVSTTLTHLRLMQQSTLQSTIHFHLQCTRKKRPFRYKSVGKEATAYVQMRPRPVL